MPNSVLSLVASLLMLTSPILTTRSAPQYDINTPDGILIGSPQEKLEYLLEHCRTENDVRNLAESFDAMAEIFDQRNYVVEAEICYLEAIQLMGVYLSKTDPKLGIEYSRLASHYCLHGDVMCAKSANTKALRILRSNLPDFLIELAVAEHNEAWIELNLGKRQLARQYLKHSLRVFKEAGGDARLLVGLITASLGELYLDEQKYAKAIRSLKSALSILEAVDGCDEVKESVREKYACALKSQCRKNEKLVHRQTRL